MGFKNAWFMVHREKCKNIAKFVISQGWSPSSKRSTTHLKDSILRRKILKFFVAIELTSEPKTSQEQRVLLSKVQQTLFIWAISYYIYMIHLRFYRDMEVKLRKLYHNVTSMYSEPPSTNLSLRKSPTKLQNSA